jgi:CheY-like chemotaxis protein
MSGLSGLTILVVEDEFFIAYEIALALSASGTEVTGLVGSVKAALEMITLVLVLDAAVLDVDQVGEKVFSVADNLALRDTPFVFATGYDADVIPQRHRAARRLVEPVTVEQIIHALIAATTKIRN